MYTYIIFCNCTKPILSHAGKVHFHRPHCCGRHEPKTRLKRYGWWFPVRIGRCFAKETTKFIQIQFNHQLIGWNDWPLSTKTETLRSLGKLLWNDCTLERRHLCMRWHPSHFWWKSIYYPQLLERYSIFISHHLPGKLSLFDDLPPFYTCPSQNLTLSIICVFLLILFSPAKQHLPNGSFIITAVLTDPFFNRCTSAARTCDWTFCLTFRQTRRTSRAEIITSLPSHDCILGVCMYQKNPKDLMYNYLSNNEI